MSIRDWIDEDLRRISESQLYGEDAAPDGEMDDLDRLQTAEALSLVEAYLRAARQLQGWLRDQLADRIAVDGKNFMYGDTLYRLQKKRRWVIEDADSLARLLGEDVSKVFRLDASNFRSTALKKIAEAREIGDTVDSMVWRETLDEWELSTPPKKYWPKYLDSMTDGDVK